MSISDPITLDQPTSPEALVEALEDQATRERMLLKLRKLWNERRFVLRCAIAGLLASILIAFLIPKLYESTAQLMPPDSQSSSNLALFAGLSGSGGLGMMAGDLLGIKSTGALFTGVLRSRTVEDRIVDRFDLKKVYGKSLQAKAREKLAERTALSEDRKSGIITLTVSDREPRRAADIANAYVEELDTLMARLTTSSAHRERSFLEERLEAVKKELDAAEKDFSQFASSKGAIDITTQGKAMVEAAASLEGQLIAAQSELQGLKQIYMENNVRVRSTQARIDELRRQLKKLGGKTENSSEKGDDYTSDAPYPTLRQLPILGVPFADKLRRLKVEEAVFETLTKQFELAKVQEAKEIPSVKILDAPVVPERKSFPPRLVIISLGLFCSTLAGVIWVLGAARWQEIDPQDPGKALAQEVVHTVAARIPWVSRNGTSQEQTVTLGGQEEGDKPRAKGTAAGT
jgi:uncharacterized protein involved in exopolysaccharide biosynthesis